MTRVTIKDVAARAGVSIKTVSRVMNGEAHVRADVRERVMKVVEETGYRPNMFARGLSSARSFLVGAFFDDPASPYASDIQRGALTRCRERGHHLLIEEVDRDAGDWKSTLDTTLRQVRLVGAILTPPICDWPELIDLFDAHGVPVVRIAPALVPERTPLVRVDDRRASAEMTQLLIAAGHRDIAFIKGPPAHGSSNERWRGFCDAMQAAGLTVADHRVLEGDYRYRSGLAAAETLLDTGTPPSAVLASNDEMAFAVLVVAMRHGITVPDRLSVVGFDDMALARMAWPQLTTVHQPNFEVAAAAVDLLIDAAEPQDAAHHRIEVPYTIVKRASVGPAAV
ncbi:transcriptional regulator, LacI family [Sphingomonas gellani]|uniref:Transcriptional regulator, LacI family n=1 Tax=Sphingomonas gellani TaxID=1166340 RepID=A0A1H8AJV0_9SPHN|nr:LacI family DNA-binding transcriptional regulator [Sphingomonas gellani]SEM70891.1 transcriptional regulator, LacI family [Sphingomonas gellani]